MKIDNVVPARPQTGLEKADIVYVEQVEAGLSRILAVYSSQLPPVVGPVRSARESDLELLRQFDRPTLAYSGAQSKLLPLIEAAPLNAVPPGKAPRARTSAAGTGRAAQSLSAAERVLRDPRGTNAAETPGSASVPRPRAGTARDRVDGPLPGRTFRLHLVGRQEAVAGDHGRHPCPHTEGQPLGAATVVLQYVTVRPSRSTTGRGTPLRTPRPWAPARRWSCATARRTRPGGRAPPPSPAPPFTTPDGRPMAFAPGQIWIVYAAR